MRPPRSTRPVAGLLAAALLPLAAACGPTPPPPPPGPAAAPYVAPQFIPTGPDRVLRATLTAAAGSVVANDTARFAVMYNGSTYPPVLKMEPDSRVDMHVVNRLPADTSYTAWTNYHYHGFNVSPMPPADNVVYIRIGPDSSYHYRFAIPADMPQGLHWYHPHPHGISQMQLQRGMSGVISVGNVLREAGYRDDLAERYLLLRDFSYAGTNSPTASCWGPNLIAWPLVNGQPRLSMSIRPGETQFWRIANVGSDRVYNLKLRRRGTNTHLPFHVIAQDGNLTVREYAADSLVIAPGNRFEVLVTAPAGPDVLEFYSPPYARDTQCTFPEVTFATVTVGGAADAPAVALQTAGSAAQADTMRMIAAATDVDTFTVVFSRRVVSPDSTEFTINDTVYVPSITNKTIPIGRVQEWTIVNQDNDLHAFHIHQGDFQVVAVRDSGQTNFRPVTPNGRQDVVMVDRWAAVKIRFVYLDPRLAGMFVFHCHMLFHEDRGMMQNLCLYDPRDPRSPAEQCANPAGGGHMGHGGGHGGGA